MTEREPHHDHPHDLPPELVETLSDHEYACLTLRTELGTVILIKAPRIEIESVRGQVPIQLGHELYKHPNAPVIRIGLKFYDQPHAPLAMETFINVADETQRADYAALGNQEEIPLLFFDEGLMQRLAKRVSHSARDVVPQVLTAADEMLGRIPPDQFDFQRAKQAIMEGTRL